MKIDIKYKVGDKVFVLDQNKIVHCEVIGINLFIKYGKELDAHRIITAIGNTSVSLCKFILMPVGKSEFGHVLIKYLFEIHATKQSLLDSL